MFPITQNEDDIFDMKASQENRKILSHIIHFVLTDARSNIEQFSMFDNEQKLLLERFDNSL